jgi:hypothetical protein
MDRKSLSNCVSTEYGSTNVCKRTGSTQPLVISCHSDANAFASASAHFSRGSLRGIRAPLMPGRISGLYCGKSIAPTGRPLASISNK